MIWFKCSVCRRHMPLRYLDKSTSSPGKLRCRVLDCATKDPRPYTVREYPAALAAMSPNEQRGATATSVILNTPSAGDPA